MVDCGNSTCVQERRLLKKELLTWTKKVPLLIGLEEVTKEVLGRRRSRKIFGQHQSYLESTEVRDWEPNTDCYFCDSTKQAATNGCSDDVDREHGCGTTAETTGVKYKDLQQLRPLSYPPSIIRDHAPASAAAATATCSSITPGDQGNRPLDLSASSRKGASCRADTESPTRAALELKVPLIQAKMGKRKDQNVKKQYTEDELVSAVNHIRSGKIGTRRASSIYGIPRSTLRNKIFRMDAEEPYYYNENRLSMCDLLQNGDLMGEAMGGDGNSLGFDWSPEEWQRRLEQLRRKHDLNAGLERPFGMPPLFFNSLHMMDCEKAFSMSNPYAYELKLPFLHELVRKFAEQRMEHDRRQQGGSANALLTDLVLSRNLRMNSLHHNPDLSSVELKIPSYKPMKNYTNGVASDTLADSPLLCESSPSPSTSNKIGDTLKDIIAKSIAERVRSRSQLSHPNLHVSTATDLARATPPEQSSTGEDSEREDPSPKRRRWEGKHEGSQPTSDSEKKQSGSDSEQRHNKKTRPKRGQYRKYNNELLLEAVRAVQRGEMSVHRAGSYFGVPHSTLEYKVKERHLLRQKKPRESRKKQSPESSSPSGSKRSESPATTSSSSASATTSTSDCSTTLQENPFPKSSTTSSNLLLSGGSPGPASSFSVASPLPLSFGWPPIMNGSLPFGVHSPTMAAYGPNFTINTSASDLLKKLQKKVQAKTGFGKLLSENEVNGAVHDGSPLSPVQGKRKKSL